MHSSCYLPDQFSTSDSEFTDCSNPSLNESELMQAIDSLDEKPCKTVSLFLSNQSLSNSAAEKITKALMHNTSVVTLYLNGANINDAIAYKIAYALENNQTLKTLYLCFNQITQIGSKALIEALQKNITLTMLDISHNTQVDAAHITILQQQLEINREIEKILNEHRFMSIPIYNQINALLKNKRNFFLEIPSLSELALNYVHTNFTKEKIVNLTVEISQRLNKSSPLNKSYFSSTLTLFADVSDQPEDVYDKKPKQSVLRS